MTRQTTVRSALGPVEVSYVDDVVSDAGKSLDALGHVSFVRRQIQIRNGMHATQEAHTLRHEWVHLVLWDSGAGNLFSEQKTEVICDAIATALVGVPIP
jgi:Zn-dependent peptidase ImmA (M78 family)